MATFNFEEAEKKLQPTAAAAPSFNFEEAEQALTKVPVSRPTPQQIERQSGAALIKPVQSTFAPYSVDETGAAFGVYRKLDKETLQQNKATREAIAELEPPKGYSFQDLHTNPDLFGVINDYTKARFGDKEGYKEGQDKEEFVKDFMGRMRKTDLNAVFYAAPELVWMRNAKPEDAAKAALARRVYEETGSALGAKGQPGIRPYVDVISALATDPVNYVGFGAGAAVKTMATKEALQQGTKALTTKAMAVGAATEAPVAIGANVIDQKLRQEVAKGMGEEPEDLSAVELGVVTLFSATLGAGAARSVLRDVKPNSVSKLNQALSKRQPVTTTNANAPLTPVEQALVDPMRDNMDDVVSEYTKKYGKTQLDQIDPATAITDSKIQTEMSKAAVRVAMKVIELDPAFQVKPNQQISDAIARVFSSIETIDDVALESALRQSGMTPDQFAAANKMTVTEAAQVMQQYSVASKMLTKMRGLDPEFDKRMKELYGADDEFTGPATTFFDGVRAVERESKVWITSGIDTTVRNVVGTQIGLSAKAAVNLMEGLIYTGGKAISDTVNGRPVIDTLKKNVGDSIADAFDTYFYMKNSGLSAEITDKLLEHNPSLRNKMLHALQETDNRDISAIGRWANTLNVAQDTFFRRAVFTSSVEQQLRRVGINLYDDILAKNKQIPSAILSKGIDDALKTTFSYMPKTQAGGVRTLESGVEGAANTIVRTIEQTPFMSLAIPFPRFMANAMAFQYRYSPLGWAGAGEDLLRANALRNTDPQKAEMLMRQGTTKVVQGAVGASALTAAYHYRMENPDTEWYNVKGVNGTEIDIRAIFPLAPYFAIADVLARKKQGLTAKTKESFEAVVGMKMPAGTQNVLLDQLIAAADSEKEADKFVVAAGKVAGDFIGRFAQPFVVKNAYDFFDLFRADGSLARDPNVIESEGGGGAFVEAAAQRVQGKLPVLKESLPEAVPRLREGPVSRDAEFFNRLVGFRQMPTRSPVEIEVAKLAIDPFSVYGSSSGDKDYDRRFIAEANKLVIPRVEQVIANQRYQQLTPVEKREVVVNTIREMTAIAREITAANTMAKDLSKVYEMRFNRLTPEKRRIINQRYAADNNGVNLDEAGDWMKLDQYEAGLADLQFNVGGLVSDAAAALVKGAVKKPKRKVSDVLKEMQQDLAPKVVDDLIPAPEVVPATKLTPQQMEKAVAPTASKSAYDFPNKAFTDDEYAAAEKTMIDDMGQMAKSMKVSNPEDYANTLHSYVATSKGLKYSETPPAPFAAKPIDDTVEPVDDIVESTYKNLPEDIEDELPVFISPKAKKGSLSGVEDFADRDDLLDQIKEVRNEAFPTLRKNGALKGIDNMVVGTVQGDFRFAKGREVDPTNSKDVAEFAKMARASQAKLNNLREKYKNTPPITLYHGSRFGGEASGVREKGFVSNRERRPTKPGQAELNVNIVSFGKDPNLQFKSQSFGGKKPERFVAVEYPYAEYVFSRVNMPQKAYSQQNLNVIARAISGDPKQVRPLGLPRADMYENEDSIVDFEKVRPSTGKLKLPDDELSKKAEMFTETRGDQQAKQTRLLGNVDAYRKDKSVVTASKVYGDIRDYSKSLFGGAKITATKTGVGQRFDRDLANMPVRPATIRDVANTLRGSGSEERASLLDKIADNIEVMDDYADVYSVKEKNKARQTLINTIPKLNKGGLVARKR